MRMTREGLLELHEKISDAARNELKTRHFLVENKPILNEIETELLALKSAVERSHVSNVVPRLAVINIINATVAFECELTVKIFHPRALKNYHQNVCDEARALMDRKNRDYGADADTLRNFRMFGLLGILVRMSDKLSRLRTFVEKKEYATKSESVHDTVIDLVNYAVLFEAYVEDARA